MTSEKFPVDSNMKNISCETRRNKNEHNTGLYKVMFLAAKFCFVTHSYIIKWSFVCTAHFKNNATKCEANHQRNA